MSGAERAPEAPKRVDPEGLRAMAAQHAKHNERVAARLAGRSSATMPAASVVPELVSVLAGATVPQIYAAVRERMRLMTASEAEIFAALLAELPGVTLGPQAGGALR